MTTLLCLPVFLPLLAAPPVPVGPVAGAEPEDHHERPAIYDDPWLRPPIWEPPVPIDPSYPRAVAFIPADSSNYTNNGLVSADYVVVHTVQGSYEGAISWFQNPSANVSAHYVMSAEGEVTQMLDDGDKGWHVGTSNSYAIGIEHEGWVDDPASYTWDMYVESARLARHLCDTHDIPIDRDHVVGHVELPNQTHSDPGPYWRWDIYMPLILDVVPRDRVEGVVVDRSKQCTVTAQNDTWITSTLMPTDDHGPDEKCFLPAGTELTYLHASPDMEGQHRLTMDGGGPCAGVGSVEWEAYIWAPDFSGLCAPEDLAAPGVTVDVDGLSAVSGADGTFAIDGVTEGAYSLDVLAGAGFQVTTVPFDQEVYPGTRLVVVVDPVDGPDPDPTGGTGGDDSGGGSSGGGDSSGGSSSGGDPGDSGGTTGDGDSGGSGGETDGDGSSGGALPPGLGERGSEEGCSCRTDGGAPPAAAIVFFLAPLLRRRRS